jgi:transcriptional regulator with XRE-family HTH domain
MTIAEQLSSSDEWELSLGSQVRSLRISHGLDQRQLAELAGASLGSVKNLEQGRGSTLKTVVRVARALDREDWLAGFAPRVSVSPIDVLRSSRREPRQRVYRPRGDS